jgi:hypothetical protein
VGRSAVAIGPIGKAKVRSGPDLRGFSQIATCFIETGYGKARLLLRKWLGRQGGVWQGIDLHKINNIK